MPAHGGPFRFFAFVVLLVLPLVLEVLGVVAVDVEIFLFQDEESVAQLAGLEINEPLGVEGEPVIPGLEMEMRTRGASCGAAQSYHISGIHPVTRFHIALGQVAMECLDAVFMSYDYKVAEASEISGHTHTTIEHCIDRVAGLERYVHPLMAPSSARTEFAAGMHITLIGAMILVK